MWISDSGNLKIFCKKYEKYNFMNKYYYLDVTLDLPEEKSGRKEDISAVYFKSHIVKSIKRLFGETGASVDFDVLKYNENTRQGILRVPTHYYVKFRSSLTIVGTYNNFVCVFKVHKAAPLLINLLGDSRDFQF